MARLVLMALVCILGGCAFAEDTVAIKYNPPANLVAIPNAQAVQVAVQGQDGRVSNKDRVGSKKNGYGMETARITAKDDIVKLMQYAVSHEMTSFGFVEGPNGLKVNVEVSTFYNDFKMGVFSGDAAQRWHST